MKRTLWTTAILILIIISMLLPSCSPNQVTTQAITSPSATRTPVATRIQQPTVLPPTATLTTTPSPFPTLINQGPYLLFEKNYHNFDTGERVHKWILMNAGGVNRRELNFLSDSYGDIYGEFNHQISPDGRWMMFYTSSTWPPYEPPYDLTLNLLSLSDLSVTPITRILSAEYPDNLPVVRDFYIEHGVEDIPDLRGFKHRFDEFLATFAWSPDSRYLAFAGQMAGDSSDLYIYDLEDGTIRRLTDDLRFVIGMEWSPDGKWILLGTAIPMVIYTPTAFHRIRPNGGLVRNPPVIDLQFGGMGEGWLSSNLYIFDTTGDTGERNGLYTVNIDTLEENDLWPGAYFSYATDPINQHIALAGAKIEGPGQWGESGTWLITFKGIETLISEEDYDSLFYLGGSNPWFIGASTENIVAIDTEGNIKIIAELSAREGCSSELVEAPSHKWFIIYDPTYPRCHSLLFSEQGDLIRTIENPEIVEVVWKADSSGIIFSDGSALYSLNVPDGFPMLIDQCEQKSDNDRLFCEIRNLAWFP